MASPAISTVAIGSVVSYGPPAGLGSKPQPSALIFNTPKSFKGFSGLKAASSINLQSDTSFLGKESNASLWTSSVQKLQPRLRATNQLQPQASFKVAVLGAAGGIGQPLALLIKMSPLVSALHLYDIANVKGVAADLSHCNTPSQILRLKNNDKKPLRLKNVS